MASSGKVALITGGGSGMGQQAARNFADSGYKVAIFDVNLAGLEETAKGRDNVKHWLVDITDFDAVSTAVREVEDSLGPVERLYNCAAIMPYGKLLEQDIKVMHKIVGINYGGLINITRAVLPGMIARRRGDFVSFASIAGVVPSMITGAYSASKAAVCMFSEILYHENKNSGVRFACVCPPAVNTPLLDQGRATHWPKMLDISGPPLSSDAVLNAIENCLEKGKFWVFPDTNSQAAAVLRRLIPGWLWKQVHKTEGF